MIVCAAGSRLNYCRGAPRGASAIQVGALSHRERVAEGRVRAVCRNVSSFEPSPWRFAPSLSQWERDMGSLDRAYSGDHPMVKHLGTVFIVGAGPGHPDLITLRGLTCLRQADVVLHDRLIDLHLLEEAKAEAEIIGVGKEAGEEDLQQDYIHWLMIQKAREGKDVCRLKGGDPFVFGRGGEEARALSESGIPFEIVPGVSSAIAVPA